MTTSMEPPPVSLRLFPSLGPLERLAPARLELGALRGLHRVCKATVDLPLRRDLLLVLPVADGQSREIRRAQRRGLGDFRSDDGNSRSEEHTSELQSQSNLVCRLLLEKKKTT